MPPPPEAPPATCRCCDGPIGHRFAAPSWRSPDWATFEVGECDACASLTLLDPVPATPFYDDYGLHRERVPEGSTARQLLGTVVDTAVLGHDRVGTLASRLVRRPYWVRWFAGTGVRLDTPVLDVGCGSGALLLDLARHGFTRLAGIDPLLPADIVYDEGLRIRRLALSEWTEQQGVVVLQHVLEHVDDPVTLLRQARRVLDPDGLIVLEVPVAQGPVWEEYRENLVSLDPPVHRFVPTDAGMSELVASAGLAIVGRLGLSPLPYQWRSELVARRRRPTVTERGPWTRAERAIARRKARRSRAVGAAPQITYLLRRADGHG